MQPERNYWPEWARFLHHWGLGELVAAWLDAAGPLNPLLAQFLYVGQPFIRGAVPTAKLDALTRLFEEQDESRAFALFLREEKFS
jgi:hypothetical protein